MRSLDTPASELFARAVVGFFILSGLVLSLPYVGEAKASLNTRQFYVERFVRLYPAYWISVLMALAIRIGVSHWVGFSSAVPWIPRVWTEPITIQSLLEHVFAVSITVRNINPVYWTLSLEIQSCLVFPLIILLARRTKHWVLGLTIVALTVLSHFFPEIAVIRPVSYFLIGTSLAKYNSELKSFARNLSTAAVLSIVILTVVFFRFAPSWSISHRLSFLVLDLELAGLMVAVQTFRPLAMIANLRPVQRFAELSYCFYLFHLPILAACAIALRPIIHSAQLTIFAAFSLSLLIAVIVHKFIEQPLRSFARSRASTDARRPYSIPATAIPETTAATTQAGA